MVTSSSESPLAAACMACDLLSSNALPCTTIVPFAKPVPALPSVCVSTRMPSEPEAVLLSRMSLLVIVAVNALACW